MATDSDASLNMAPSGHGGYLHNKRAKDLGNVGGFGSSKHLNRVGDLLIPHHTAGINIFEAAGVKANDLPTGTAFSFGLAKLVALGIDVTTFMSAPPLVAGA